MKNTATTAEKIQDDLTKLVRQKEIEAIRRCNVEDYVDYFKYDNDEQAQEKDGKWKTLNGFLKNQTEW